MGVSGLNVSATSPYFGPSVEEGRKGSTSSAEGREL